LADVAYDLFTASTPSGDSEFEIMIWLAALGGAGPISATGKPIASPTIAGHSWKLSKGLNGKMTVFSFVAPTPIKSFNGDLMAFFRYLETSQGLKKTQFLKSIAVSFVLFCFYGMLLECVADEKLRLAPNPSRARRRSLQHQRIVSLSQRCKHSNTHCQPAVFLLYTVLDLTKLK
jgi:Glycosyl hydrolase family 12